MSNLNSFSRGLARAAAQAKDRRAKEEAQATIQKVDSDVSNATTTEQIEEPSNLVPETNLTTLSDDQYQTTIIQKMLNHIKQKRTNQDD
jgi:hypothetical protein